MRHGYGVYGEQIQVLRFGPFRITSTWYVVTIYDGPKPRRSWIRFSFKSALRKGEIEQRRADAKDAR